MKPVVVRKWWVEFFSPGLIVAETSCRDCKVNTKPEEVKWPRSGYAFVLKEREDIVYDGKTYEGAVKQVGPMYYHPDSTIETLEQVRSKRDSDNTLDRILLLNMESNKWDKIIWTRWGNWPQPYDSKQMKILGGKHGK